MHHHEELANLTPARPKVPRVRRRRKTGTITKDDAFWNIIGMALMIGGISSGL
jgi:hypothetical protein